MSTDKPRRLGRGLEALIQGAAATPPASDLQRIPVARIRPNPYQPRREFDAAELADLQTSLKASGLLQPITVRRKGDAYELIAGERRLRAATSIGWIEITAIVRDFDDQTMLVLALVENLQRANLNPIEEARGYRRLIDEFKLTQHQVADAVGKDRTTVTNLLRVLSLPQVVQGMVERGSLSLGHARALLPLGQEETVVAFANDAATGGISVRELEQRVRDALAPTADHTKPSVRRDRALQEIADPAVRRIEDDLRKCYQTDARVHLSGESKGRIELSFYSNDDLDRILDLMLGNKRSDY